MAGFQGYRHLLTSAPARGAAGAGFRTVAAAAELDAVRPELERKVGRYRRTGPAAGHRTRQLLHWDREGEFCLLTTFTPLGEGPDGRSGNYLAESLLVPSAWLAGFAWDPDAAFEAVDWRGPGALDELDPDAALPPEDLTAPSPGPLARLAALAEDVRGEALDRLLLGMVRASGGRERLAVVEADERRPAVLERVVALLPLAVPPAGRRVPGGPSGLPLELRTRGPADGMPEVHVAGVAAGERDAADRDGRRVVDLAGVLPVDEVVDPAGYEYVEWLKRVIAGGRWDELERLYELADEVPADELFRRFPSLRERAARGGVEAGRRPLPGSGGAGGSAPPRPPAPARAPLPARRERWAGRRELEATAAAGHDAYRDELDAILGLLRAENERAVAELRKAIKAWRPDLVAAFGAERERLRKTLAGELEKEAIAVQARLYDDAGRVLAQVREEGDALLADMRRELAARGGPARRPRTWRLLPRGMAWARGRGKPAPWLWAAGAVLLALLAVGGWWGWRAWAGGGDDAEPGTASAAPASPTDEPLLSRLREPGVAAALLARAATRPETAEAAAATALALRLGEAGIGGEARCMLLQTSLRGAAGPPLAVDGDCGARTASALAAAVGETCCAGLTAVPTPTSPRAACLLSRRLELPDDAACDGADPFRAGRTWSRGEAERALALLRAAREAAGARGTALSGYDLGEGAAVLAALRGQDVSAREAGMLLELARAVAGPDGSTASTEEIAELLDELEASPPAAGTGAS